MKTVRYFRKKHGFTLSEVSLALGVIAFCLVSVFGLLSVGLKNTRDITSRTSASEIVSLVVSDLRGSAVRGASGTDLFQIPYNSGTSTLYLSGIGDGATRYVRVPNAKDAEYQVNVVLSLLGDRTMVGSVRVFWPVYSGTKTPPPPVSSVVVPVAFELP